MTYFVHYKDKDTVNRVLNVLHICTANDANGNPRRLIVCLGDYGHIVSVFDEDHDWGGLYQLDRKFAEWTRRHCVRVNVTVSEYNSWRTFAPGKVARVSTAPELPIFQE